MPYFNRVLSVKNVGVWGPMLERWLIAGVVLLAMYVAGGLIFGRLSVPVEMTTVISKQSLSVAELVAPKAVADFSIYEDQIRKRDIFSFAPDPQQGATPGAAAEESLPAPWKVVAVMIGPKSEIVIEDAQAGQIYYIEEGTAWGAFELLEVRNDQMAVRYKGKIYTIKVKK